MQYAQIVVDRKTGGQHDTFTYSITPSQLLNIKVGQAVIVPFRSKKVSGIVVRLSKKISAGLNSSKILPIDKILTKSPILDSKTLKLVHWMSHFYGATLAQSMFSVLPEFPKKPLEHDHPVENIHQHKNNQKLVIRGSLKNRIGAYIKIIEKLNTSDSLLVIFPTKIVAREFANLLGSSAYYMSDELTTRQKLDLWIDSRLGRVRVIVGCLSTIFIPSNNLSTIIIDDPNHPAHRSIQQPNYSSLEVGRVKSNIYNCNLVVGCETLPLELCMEISKKQWRFINLSKICEIETIIFSSTINQPFESNLAYKLQQNNKIIIFQSNNFVARSLYCLDCNTPVECSVCKKPAAQQNQNTMICMMCNNRFPTQQECLKCKSSNIKPWKPGMKSTLKWLRINYPNKQIFVCDNDNSLPVSFNLPDNSILLGSQKIFDLINLEVDLTIIFDASDQLYYSHFRSEEFLLKQIKSLFNRSKKLCIQINSTLQPSLSKILSNNWLRNEIGLRKKYYLPPFARQIIFDKEFVDILLIGKSVDKIKNVLLQNKQIYSINHWMIQDKAKVCYLLVNFSFDLQVSDVIKTVKWHYSINPYIY